jgi:hypothetical protein
LDKAKKIARMIAGWKVWKSKERKKLNTESTEDAEFTEKNAEHGQVLGRGGDEEGAEAGRGAGRFLDLA